MKPRIIKTEADYEAALARIDQLMQSDPDPATDDGAELELLGMLVEQYEEVHFPIDIPSPVEIKKFACERFKKKQPTT
jgi:HTH-type transcriptional regulator/antitoxin HigA